MYAATMIYCCLGSGAWLHTSHHICSRRVPPWFILCADDAGWRALPLVCGVSWPTPSCEMVANCHKCGRERAGGISALNASICRFFFVYFLVSLLVSALYCSVMRRGRTSPRPHQQMMDDGFCDWPRPFTAGLCVLVNPPRPPANARPPELG